MNPESKILLEEYNSEFKKYKSHIAGNSWLFDVRYDPKKNKLQSSKLDLEISIIDTILKSTLKFKEDVGDDIDKKPIQDFIKFTSVIINDHISRMQKYKRDNPIGKYSEENDGYDEEGNTRTTEESNIEFHSDLFALITKTKVTLSRLKIDENELSKKSADLFFANAKAPLMMREYLCKRFPVIKDRTENLGLNFSVPHINPATSNELLINMRDKDIPKWDPNKHYFEQDLSTIQFWEEERNKIKNGINIGGFHMSNWLYWHSNMFKMAFGAEEDKDMKIAHLRDTEYFFDHMYNKAKAHGRKGVFSYGSRRIAKSAGMTSRLLHGLWTIRNAKGTVQGFSKVPDLEAILTYANDAIQNMFPALKIPANSITMADGVVLGLKGKKVQDRYDFAHLAIVNLEGGNTMVGGQKTAGATPDIFLLDEAGKGDCIKPWKAAKPSFAGGKNGTWRLVPLLSGTAGEGELSVDAELMLKNPDAYDILQMDWDFLESFIDPDYVTWKRNTFGFFVPAQLSIEGPDKLVSNFADFLDIKNNPELSKVEMHVTDWKASKEFFEEKRRLVSSDLDLLAGETNSFPLDPEDCYITTEVNMFPGMECKNRKRHIEDEGLDGQAYRFRKGPNGEPIIEMSTDPIILDYPYKGGNFDAPVMLLENPMLWDSMPPLGLICIGFDDAKQDTSSGDSVLSARFFKRSFEGGEWANRFIGGYDSRPDRKKDYYKVLHLVMKALNARLLHENEDNGFIEFLEDNHPEDLFIHVSTGVGLASEENLNRNQNRKWGWSPTPNNIYHAEQKLVRYSKSQNNVVGNQEGLSGVDIMNDRMLLQEMYKYKKKQNADRIRSASLALTLAQYYDRSYQYMKYRKRTPQSEEEFLKKQNSRKSSRGLSDTRGLTRW